MSSLQQTSLQVLRKTLLTQFAKKKFQDNLRKDQKPLKIIKRTIATTAFPKKEITDELQLFIHRGAGIHMEHNSIEAFQYAVDQKAKGIELDIWLTKDNKVLVMHGDENIDGKIGQDEKGNNIYLYNMTEKEIKDYLKGKNQFCKQPLFEQVLDLCKNKLIIDVELKGKTLNGIQKDLARKAIDLVRQKKMEKEIFFSSFNHEYYEVLRSIYAELKMEEIPFGFLFESLQEMPNLDKVKPQNTSIVFPFQRIYQEQYLKFILEAKKKGLELISYIPFRYSENFSMYSSMYNLGIRRIITNSPQTLKAFKEKFGFK